MGIADFFRAGHRSSDPDTRLKAVERTADQKILADLACGDPSPRVRMAAVARLTDQTRLESVALDGHHIDARIGAVERIDSQQSLAGIIKRRRNYELMGACFARITDVAILEQIAHDPEYNMSARRMAIDNYADESFLDDLQAAEDGAAANKTPEQIDALIARYGGTHLARALGKFRGSPNAMTALGHILGRGDDAAETALEYLASGLIHANREVRRCAEEQLVQLTDRHLILHLIRLMDRADLHEAIMRVLGRMDSPDARRMTGRE